MYCPAQCSVKESVKKQYASMRVKADIVRIKKNNNTTVKTHVKKNNTAARMVSS